MENNPVNWFEIYVDDMDRATNFYRTVLGLEMKELPMPEGMDMKMFSFPWIEGGLNATGALVKSENIKAGGNNVLVYFQCENCQVEQDRVEDAGGKIIQSKYPIGQHGFCAICQDTEGNNFGLHSMK